MFIYLKKFLIFVHDIHKIKIYNCSIEIVQVKDSNVTMKKTIYDTVENIFQIMKILI